MVGEYIRTKKGQIYKIEDGTEFYEDSVDVGIGIIPDVDGIWVDKGHYNYVDKRNIKAHSKNIIDLIEVGDYVNGHLIVNIEIDKNKRKIITENKYFAKYYENGIAKIETIVTKEAFASAEYRVETY